jgi:hypothetical protein
VHGEQDEVQISLKIGGESPQVVFEPKNKVSSSFGKLGPVVGKSSAMRPASASVIPDIGGEFTHQMNTARNLKPALLSPSESHHSYQ